MPLFLVLVVFLRIISRVMDDAVVTAAQSRLDGVALQSTDYCAANHGGPCIARLEDGDAPGRPREDLAVEILAAAEAPHEEDGADGLLGDFEDLKDLGPEEVEYLVDDGSEDFADFFSVASQHLQ